MNDLVISSKLACVLELSFIILRESSQGDSRRALSWLNGTYEEGIGCLWRAQLERRKKEQVRAVTGIGQLLLRPRLEKECSILLLLPVSTSVLWEREIVSAITCLRAQLCLTPCPPVLIHFWMNHKPKQNRSLSGETWVVPSAIVGSLGAEPIPKIRTNS